MIILTNKEIKDSFKIIFRNKPDKYKYYILDNFKVVKEHINRYFSDKDKLEILNFKS